MKHFALLLFWTVAVSACDLADKYTLRNEVISYMSDPNQHPCGSIDNWDVSRIQDLSFVFYNMSTFNGNISNWDTSRVTNMNQTFARAASFNRNISTWDTSSVTNMYGTFAFADSFNGNISTWDTSKVTNMNGIFWSSSSFNGDLSTWDTSRTTDLSWSFGLATSFNGNISTWDTSRVTIMLGTFLLATSFNGDLSTWDTSRVTTMTNIFDSASSFNGDISTWDTSKTTDLSWSFYNAISFTGRSVINWNVSNVLALWDIFSGTVSVNPCVQDRIHEMWTSQLKVSFPYATTWNTDACCGANEYVSENTCRQCPLNEISDAGSDPFENITTSCFCNENHHVIDSECVSCAAGRSRNAGDSTSNGDTQCDWDPPCGINEHVLNHTCVACPFGRIHPEGGDELNETNTECFFCAPNFYVNLGECVACGDGYIRSSSYDDIRLGNTSCSICSENHHVIDAECVACDSGTWNDAGDSNSNGDTLCTEYPTAILTLSFGGLNETFVIENFNMTKIGIGNLVCNALGQSSHQCKCISLARLGSDHSVRRLQRNAIWSAEIEVYIAEIRNTSNLTAVVELLQSMFSNDKDMYMNSFTDVFTSMGMYNSILLDSSHLYVFDSTDYDAILHDGNDENSQSNDSIALVLAICAAVIGPATVLFISIMMRGSASSPMSRMKTKKTKRVSVSPAHALSN